VVLALTPWGRPSGRGALALTPWGRPSGRGALALALTRNFIPAGFYPGVAPLGAGGIG